MAYITKYQITFTNENYQEVFIFFDEKDGAAGPAQEYAAVNVKMTYNGDEGKFNPVYGLSLDMEFDMLPADIDYFADFSSATKDTWKVTVTVEGKIMFIGTILPDEGGVPFQDRPYNAKVTAVDGIGLLKDIPLVKFDGTQFSGHQSIITYIASITQATGLQLPIRVYDFLTHSSFNDRSIDLKWDMVSQTYVEARTFLKTATTFYDCYTVLERICTDGFRFFQWNGKWVLIRLGMMQFYEGDGYYTEYDYTGHNQVGYEIVEDYASVGKNELIYPHGEDQMKYYKKAVQSATSNFEYEIWPEIPTNNKFERGTLVGGHATAVDDIDEDGDNDFTETIGYYQNSTIDGWDWGEVHLVNSPDFPLVQTGLTAPVCKRIFNDFDLEIRREIVINPSPNTDTFNVVVLLKSEAIPVVQGDRISFGIETRFSENWDAGDINRAKAALVYIVTPTGGFYFLESQSSDPDREGKWLTTSFRGGLDGSLGFINVLFGETDKRKFASVNVDSQPIPVSGNLYVACVAGSALYSQYFRNVSLDYKPFVGGGFQQIKGERWKFTQTAQQFPDISESTVYLSDNIHKIFKGTLLNDAGIPLTADWHRYGVDEHRAYNDLINYHKFQLQQRRYWFIEGSFTGFMFEPNNERGNYQPIGLHKQYRFSDITQFDKRFILGATLEIDLVKAWITGRFHEVFIDNKIFFDGQRGGTSEFKYIFQ